MKSKTIRTTKLLAGFRILSEVKQAELGRAIGRSQSHISLIEAGQWDPDEEDQKKIAEFFDVPVDFLFPVEETTEVMIVK